MSTFEDPIWQLAIRKFGDRSIAHSASPSSATSSKSVAYSYSMSDEPASRSLGFDQYRCIVATMVALIALILIAHSVTDFRRLARIPQALEHERTTPLAQIDCDLSRPCELNFPIRIDYPYGHGIKLLVVGPDFNPNSYDPEPWLHGLAGDVTLTTGTPPHSTTTNLMDFFSFASGPDSRAIARVLDIRTGTIDLRLRITAGAPGLANYAHRLVIMNDVCGCELLGVLVMKIVRCIEFSLGLLAALIAFKLTKRRRHSHPHAPFRPATTS